MSDTKPYRNLFFNSGKLHDRDEFAARVRAARAVLGWTQAELGARAGITQRSVNRLEQADVDVRHSTALAIERVFREAGISFISAIEGEFEMRVVRSWTKDRERT